MKSPYATVDELLVILKKVSDAGKGHYLVTCNNEYFLARRCEEPKINEQVKWVDLGGYASID